MDDAADILHKGHHSGALCGECFDTDLLPLLVESVCGARNGLVRSCSVENTHKYITVYNSLKSLHKHGRRVGEARIRLHTVRVDGDDRDLRHSGFFQSTADKSDVVRRTAAASGLAHEDGRVVEIILSGQQGIHDLSDDDQGRVAGVIVYIF